MGVNFKALGGLIEFKYITDIEDLDLDDLNEDDIEELEKLKEKIDAKNPKAKKEDKPKTAKEVLGDKDIPYEVRMKYIIDAYRKDQEKWGKLAVYAKHLEGEVIRLKEILIENGYTNNAVIGDYEPNKELKELRTKVCKLESEKKRLLKILNNTNVKALENTISTYPLKIYRVNCFKSIIESQKEYIKELQELLDKNDIPYAPRLPANDLDKEGVDHIVEEARKYLKMNKKVIEEIIERWEST